MKTLSRFLMALVAVLLVGAPPLAAAYSTALNAVTTGTASAIIPSGGAANVEIYLRSAAGSTSTVTIELCATNAVASCYIVVTKADVAAAGAWYSGPSGPFFRVNASAVSAGAVTALYGMNNAAKLARWTDLKLPTESGAGVIATTDVNASGTVTAATLASTGGITAASTVAATTGVSGTTGAFSTSSTSPLFIGGLKSTIAAKLTDGAIASSSGVIVITKGSALGASTLATPTITTHDGYELTIVSSTAFAHIITVTTGKLNAAAVTTVTFTSAAIGDSVTLVAYQGIWYLVGKTGTITLS